MKWMSEKQVEKTIEEKQRTHSKQLLYKIALLILAISCSFIFCEILTRVFFGNNMGLFPRYHTDATYDGFTIRKLRPNMVFWHRSVDGAWEFRTNSQGFRNDFDFTYDKKPGTIRVICLGDSNVQGFEARQDYILSSFIQRFLNKEGLKAEVYNMGISGYSTSEELVLLEKEAIKYKPDYIVLGFFANDYEDNVRANLFTVQDGKLVLNKREYIPGVKILNWINQFYVIRKLSENSYFYSFVFNHVWQFFKDRMLERAKTEYALPRQSVPSTYEKELAKLLLGQIMACCRSYNIRFVLVDIPQVVGNNFQNSMDQELVTYVKQKGGIYIDTASLLLAPYRDLAEIHVPNGARHITEFTHLMVGVKVGQVILNERK
jgi:hypothetical protein